MSADASTAPALTVEEAARLYVYGYPLVYNLEECESYVEGSPRFPMASPYNAFGHARELAGPTMRFVSPNNDTCYSIAVCDVRKGPLRLAVPDTGGRYYVLQLVDAWTNNFSYIGRRATGTEAGEYVLAGPDTDPATLPDLPVVHAPSGIFTIVGRLQVDGPEDLPEVHALQDAFTLTPLDPAAGTPDGVPVGDASIEGPLKWWDDLRVALRAFPPPPADADLLETCRRAGLLDAESPFLDPDPALAEVLTKGEEQGVAMIEQLMSNLSTTPEGWNAITHVFDYNLDHFEIGALPDPEWRIADRTIAYATRAVAARAGLWGNHGYEAAYASIWIDSDGEPLDGNHRYRLHLAAPPVDAFWSLTMYDVPDFFLVDNPIDRYSIGDRTPGLRVEPDGSVVVHIQADAPEGDDAANWLPCPRAPFRPLMRLYQPQAAYLDGTYVLAPITRVD